MPSSTDAPNEAMNDVARQRRPPRRLLNATRPFYWSVRRELWENRFLYLAPLAVAALVLVGLLLSTIGMAQRLPDDPAAAAGQAGGVDRPALMISRTAR